MKRTLLFLYILGVCLYQEPVYAQSLYFTHGYSGNFTSMKGLKEVTNNYNDTRSWLDKEMGSFGNLDGYSVSAGGMFGGALWTDFEYGFRGKKKKAYGTDLFGNFGTRELRLRNNTFSFTFGGGKASHQSAVMGGIRLEIGNHNLKSRVYYDGEEKGEWDLIDSKLLTGKVGPTIHFLFSLGDGLIFTLTSYYVFGIFDTNMTYTDEEINNSFYNYESPDKFNNSNHTFGFRLAVGFLSIN